MSNQPDEPELDIPAVRRAGISWKQLLDRESIATGGTVKAALQALAKTGVERMVLAVPLAPRDVIPALRELCDQVVCLSSPEPFYAVGAHYRDFRQTEDDEVIRLLAETKNWIGERSL